MKIRGAGGGGGGKGGGGGGGRTPVESPDSLRSISTARVLDLLCEGEIHGLVDGLKSVYLNETPLQNPDGSYNFKDVSIESRNGSQAQTYIPGYSEVENETPVGQEVTIASGPVARTVTNPDVDAVRVTIAIPQLTYQDPTNGDLGGVGVRFAIDTNSNGAGWVERVDHTVRGKSTSKYEQSVLIGLEGSGPWQVRVRRITEDSASVTIQHRTVWQSYTEIVDAKLSYPNSALVGVAVNASQFSSVPRRAYDVKLMKIRIPSNASVRADGSLTYSGSWNGSFQIAWCANPAWVFYDLVTSDRYGLGGFISEDQVDKWALYTAGKYCDELVPSGFGTYEPRFTCNIYLQTRAEAFKVVNDLASIFRGMVYWSAGSLTIAQDAPQDASALFTPANVVEGVFNYAGASMKARHTVALVAWNDPADFYRQKIEYVEDADNILRYGVIETQIVAVGCTSRGQAHRLGRWLLQTELYQSETVAFQTGLEGAVCRPGQVIKIADPVRSGSRTGGRVGAGATTSAIPLDSIPPFTSGALTFSVLLPNGTVEERSVASFAGQLVNLSSPLSLAPQQGAVWIIASSTVEAQTFRVVSVAESKPGMFDVLALAHNPGKFASVDNGTILQARSISALDETPDAPTSLTITETLYAVGKDVRVKVTCGWTASPNAAAYQVQYKRDDNNFVRLPETQSNEVEVLNAEPGHYVFQVIALSPLGKQSVPVSVEKDVLGRGAAPGAVQNFSLMPAAGSRAQLSWDKSVDLDVLIGGNVRIRFSPNTVDPVWRDSVDIVPALAGTATRVEAPLLPGTYLAKFVDADGKASDVAALIVTTIPEALAVNNVLTLTENPAWAGAKTYTEYRVDLGGVALGASTLIDSIPDIDAIPAWDYAGGVASEGEYFFASTVELGDVYTSKITAMVQANAVDVADTIDFRDEPVDDWLDLDGDFIDDVNAAVYVRTTEDNSASPSAVWTEWKPFFVGEYKARGLQFKVKLTSQSSYHNVVLESLSVSVDMEDRTINMPGLVSSASAAYTVNFEAPFKAAPAVGIMGHNMVSGDYFTIANKTNSSFDITFKNSAGTIVARTFDVIAKGYGRAV